MTEGTFTNIVVDALAASARDPPPDNCSACEIPKKFDEGVDAEEGPRPIGQIIKFDHGDGYHDVKVEIQLFGRIDKARSWPDTALTDEVGLLVRGSVPAFTSSRLETSFLHGRCDGDHSR